MMMCEHVVWGGCECRQCHIIVTLLVSVYPTALSIEPLHLVVMDAICYVSVLMVVVVVVVVV